MGYIFICKKCGDIKSIDWKVGTRHLTCNKCAEPMDWSNAFPPQSVIDFRNTVDSLFELSKEHDKENLDIHYDFLKNNFEKFDKTQLDKYINQYEKICEKYPDNDDTLWQTIDDKFSYEAGKYMNREQLSSIIPAVNSEVFLAKYNTAGIQSVIDITDSFLDEPLKKQMDKFSNGFFDRWATLRNLRNSIIHSNNKYITKIKLSNMNKLIKESYTVFSQLKSNLYKEKD